MRARTEAEEANRAKDELLATLSHEMRTPLTPIIGWVRMLRNGMLEGDKAAHGLTLIDKNEALQIARTAEFDVTISDIGLPEIDGYEMIKQFRSVPHLRDTPAVALTGCASQQYLARALSAGFDAHVAKPVDPSLLLAQIERQLLSTHRHNGVVP